VFLASHHNVAVSILNSKPTRAIGLPAFASCCCRLRASARFLFVPNEFKPPRMQSRWGPLALFLCLCGGAFAAEQNRPPRLIAMGCNFDGGRTWLALGKARAGSELDSFRVEIPDVDLERVEPTISPSNMDMFMPYGQGPVVGPIKVSRISIAPRTVDGFANGNVITVHFNILSSYSTPTDFLQPDAISYILVLNNKSTGCRR
jgi:hypothetical protein